MEKYVTHILKFGAILEHSSPRLVSQAGYGPAY